MGHPGIEALIRDTWASAWSPPPRLGVADWAGRHRYLSPEASAEHGLWRNARAPYLVAPMDALSPYHPAERVVCWFSSQTGKTEIILNFIGYIVDLDPGPILAIQPNVTPMGEAFSKDRINPMFRDSPTLAAKVGQARARTSAQTITHKTFPGGHLTIAGANSPAGLASRPIRYLVCDELDRWEVTKEGDPLTLARKRLQTYRARRASKELVVSSPTYDDIGICAEYGACTQQYEWHLPCLHCGAYQMPALRHYHYDGDPSTVRYVCSSCGGTHDLDQADRVKAGGRWVLVRDGPAVSLGYRMNQWASSFARWDDTLAEWVGAKSAAERQVVTNTVFAEPWEGEGDALKPHALAARAETYPCEVPAGVLAITVGADVQGDRIEAEVVGWGAGAESWSLAYEVLPGDPTAEDVWSDLLDLYRTSYTDSRGQAVRAIAMCVDSGAYTAHVYGFVRRARDRGVIAVKGVSGMTRDAVTGDERARRKRTARRMATGRPPEIVGVDAIKRTIYHHLGAPRGSPGHCHFPAGRADEYYEQLTGERLMPVQTRGRRPELRWVQMHAAVEALDCRVYAYAALLLANPTLEAPTPRAAPVARPFPSRYRRRT